MSGTFETSLIQRGLLRWQHDQVALLLPTARSVFANLGDSFPGLALVLARVLAEDEASDDETRAILARFAVDDFAQLPRGTFWSSALVLTAETAFIVDSPETSRVICDLLLPFADQVAFPGIWVTAPIAYGGRYRDARIRRRPRRRVPGAGRRHRARPRRSDARGALPRDPVRTSQPRR